MKLNYNHRSKVATTAFLLCGLLLVVFGSMPTVSAADTSSLVLGEALADDWLNDDTGEPQDPQKSIATLNLQTSAFRLSIPYPVTEHSFTYLELLYLLRARAPPHT
jgi:hypothetical protein